MVTSLADYSILYNYKDMLTFIGTQITSDSFPSVLSESSVDNDKTSHKVKQLQSVFCLQGEREGGRTFSNTLPLIWGGAT